MGARRVVITGIGVISPLGRNAAEFWEALREGRPGIAPIETVDCSQLRFRNGAEVHGYNPDDYFDPKIAGFLDRFAQFALIAAREAVADSGVEWTSELRERSAIVTGSCVGGQCTQDKGFVDLYVEKRTRVNPLTIPRTMANAGASYIAMEYGLHGAAFTISTACSSSNHAVGHAFWMVRQGTADLAVTGGSEAPFSLGSLKAWEALRVVSPETCRPFTKDRKGMILGEGGAMLVLEPLEAAKARGARVYAEIVGFGMSSDAHHITQPSAEGPARAMRSTLADGGVHPDAIGYINAHGTGTQANDPTEARAIHDVLASQAGRVAVSSTKSMHGHALGAAGGIEAAATALALHHGILPPTANFTKPDPECHLDVIPNTARRAEVEYALSNSFAFGGLNAVVAFRRWNGA
jgi:nodulation protein E